jgi:dolichyl-phosphate-mannose-protein mannosyltransferase
METGETATGLIGGQVAFKRLRQWCMTMEGKRFLILFTLALLVRLILAPFHGFFGDVQNFVDWGVFLDHHFLNFYSVRGTNAIPDYPPLAMYLFGYLTGLYSFLGGHLSGPEPGLLVFHSTQFALWMKLPVILADLGAVALIYGLACRRLSPQWALAATAAYAFSPAVLFGGVLWGQIEPIFELALLLSLVLMLRHRGGLAGIMFGLAIMLKPQPVVLAPIILVYLWRWAGWRQALHAVAGIATTSIVICLPYLLPPYPQVLAFYHDVNDWLRLQPQASISAYNLWWLLGVQGHNYKAPYLGPLSPDILGWALFAVVLLIVLGGLWKDPSSARLFMGTALVALAFFDVTTLQRERYLFPVLACFFIAALYDRRNTLFFVLTSLTLLANEVMIVILNPASEPGVDVKAWANFLTQHPQIPVVVSNVNMLLLLGAMGIYLFGSPAAHQAELDERSPEYAAAATQTGTPHYP